MAAKNSIVERRMGSISDVSSLQAGSPNPQSVILGFLIGDSIM
jgi:hypothetical protein